MTSPDAAACHAVLVDFLGLVDRGRATEALQLFTPDATMVARGEEVHGHEGIARFLADREAETERHRAHLVANVVALQDDGGEVELSALVFLHERAADGSYPVLRVLDTVQQFRRTDVGWRISGRAAQPLHAPRPD